MKNTEATYFVDQIVVVVLSYETFMKPLDFLLEGAQRKGCTIYIPLKKTSLDQQRYHIMILYL